MSLNKVMLIGNVGNDPEVRYLDPNQAPGNSPRVARFRLATTDRYKDRNGETRENTEWHSITAWRSNAEFVEGYVKKGSQVYVEGRLRNRQWTDQNGQTRYTTEVEVTNIQLLGRRPDSGDGQSRPQAQPAYQQPQQPAYQQPQQPAYQQPYQAPQQPQYQPQPQYQAPQQPVAPQAPDNGPEDDLPF